MSRIKARCCIYVVLVASIVLLELSAGGQVVEKVPSIQQVKQVVRRHFEREARGEYAIVVQRDIKKILAQLKSEGWEVSDGKVLIEQTLDDSNYLVQQLQSRAGQRFLRKTAKYPMVISRLDRLAREPGGRALVRDLVRLPNGERYANPNPPRGVPEMSEFLPKRGNSRQPKVKAYRQPTGRIYSESDLLKRLEQSHKRDFAKAKLDEQKP